MDETESGPDRERRLRRAASTAASRQAPEPDGTEEPDDSAAGQRLEQQTLWVDQQVRRAIERGEFDNLPGAGKPIRGLGGTHDPDWWVKQLIEREQITGVLPPALALRQEDAELEARLDSEATEDGVRGLVDDFNRRVVDARRQLLGGPPVVTRTRDVEAEVEAWHTRRTQRLEGLRRQRAERAATSSTDRRSRRSAWRSLGRRHRGI